MEITRFKEQDLARILTCKICGKIPSPDQVCGHKTCNGVFCFTCLEGILQSKGRTCPHCRKEMKKALLAIEENQFLYSLLTSLNMHCPSSGCFWEGTYGNLEEHRKICQFFVQPCKYSKYGCSTQGTQRDLEYHYTETKQAHLDLLFSQIQGKSDSKISSSEREIKELQILIEEAKKNISRKKEQCERFKMQIRQTEEELERRYLKREEEYENVVIKGNRLLEVIEHLRRDLKALQCEKQQLEAEIEALKEELKN